MKINKKIPSIENPFDSSLILTIFKDIIARHKLRVILILVVVFLAVSKVYLTAKNRDNYHKIDVLINQNHSVISKNNFLRLKITEDSSRIAIKKEVEILDMIKVESNKEVFVEYE